MRKLTVDEIIQGLVDAYEKLLILAEDPNEGSPAEYHHAIGEVTALRWVLGQEMCSIDSTMPEDTMADFIFLSDKQRDDILAVAMKISDEKFGQIQELIEDATINTMNYKGSIAKLRRQRLESDYGIKFLDNDGKDHK